MGVVGFDIGNENSRVGVILTNAVDIAMNESSSRETPSLVTFADRQRFQGVNAAAIQSRYPLNTISQIKWLIGKTMDDPALQADLGRLPFNVVAGEDGLQPLVTVQYRGEQKKFSPTQILSMLFVNLKGIAERHTNQSGFSNCMIGVPRFFSQAQRRAYMDAAMIAGLNPVGLLHETTAIALAYGFFRNPHLPTSDCPPIHVAFVDVGHSSMQVCIAKFHQNELKIVGYGFDQSLGGRDFNQALFDFFSEKFRGQHGINISSNDKAKFRLYESCEKMKKVLSTNSDAAFSIECIMDEKDMQCSITRDCFETELVGNLLDRVAGPCERAMAEANLNVNDIDSVEVVGSGSRIPAILNRLSKFFNKNLSRTMNASECIASGCTIQCALLSPNFRGQKFEVQESMVLPVSVMNFWEGPALDQLANAYQDRGLRYESEIPSTGALKLPRNEIFAMGNANPTTEESTSLENQSDAEGHAKLGTEILIKLRKCDSSSFILDMFFKDPRCPTVYSKTSRYEIGSFKDEKLESVNVEICLDLGGTVSVKSAYIIEYIEQQGHANEDTIMEDVKTQEDSGTKGWNSRVRTVEDGQCPEYEENNDADKDASKHPQPSSDGHGENENSNASEEAKEQITGDKGTDSHVNAGASGLEAMDHEEEGNCINVKGGKPKEAEKQTNLETQSKIPLAHTQKNGTQGQVAGGADNSKENSIATTGQKEQITGYKGMEGHVNAGACGAEAMDREEEGNCINVKDRKPKEADKQKNPEIQSKTPLVGKKRYGTQGKVAEGGDNSKAKPINNAMILQGTLGKVSGGGYNSKVKSIATKGQKEQLAEGEELKGHAEADATGEAAMNVEMTKNKEYEDVQGLPMKVITGGTNSKGESNIMNGDEEQDVRPLTSRRPLLVKEVVGGGMTKEELEEARYEEHEMQLQDLETEKINESKNALETYVYDTRDKVCEKYLNYATADERTELLGKLQETEDWLYEGGKDESKDAYDNRLLEIRKLGDPIEQRFKEYESLPESILKLNTILRSWCNMAKSMDPKYSHIKFTERNKVRTVCMQAHEWLKANINQQNQLAHSVDPFLRTNHINDVIAEVEGICRPIFTKKRTGSRH